MTPARVRALAEAGYRGYYKHTNGLTFDGRPMPEWETLHERIVEAWCAAVRAQWASDATAGYSMADTIAVLQEEIRQLRAREHEAKP